MQAATWGAVCDEKILAMKRIAAILVMVLMFSCDRDVLKKPYTIIYIDSVGVSKGFCVYRYLDSKNDFFKLTDSVGKYKIGSVIK